MSYTVYDENEEEMGDFDTLAEAKRFLLESAPGPGDYMVFDNESGVIHSTINLGKTWSEHPTDRRPR